MVNPTQISNPGVTSQNAAAIDKPNILSSQRLNTTNSPNIDDVIGSLANAYENKRARQVIEWERLWRQNFFGTSRSAFL